MQITCLLDDSDRGITRVRDVLNYYLNVRVDEENGVKFLYNLSLNLLLIVTILFNSVQRRIWEVIDVLNCCNFARKKLQENPFRLVLKLKYFESPKFVFISCCQRRNKDTFILENCRDTNFFKNIKKFVS